jgi:hypothetical protein
MKQNVSAFCTLALLAGSLPSLSAQATPASQPLDPTAQAPATRAPGQSSKLYIADQRQRGYIIVGGRSPHELPGSLQNSQTQFLCGEDGRGLKALSHAL